jgi:hypothetical protein
LMAHPEMSSVMGLIRATVEDPDQVQRNKRDEQMALFYRAIGEDYFLRVAVLMQPDAGALAHSVISARKAYKAELERGQGRLAWKKQRLSSGGTTTPSWP